MKLITNFVYRSRNSTLKGKALSSEALILRKRAVSTAIAVIASMDDAGVQEVLGFTETETREDLLEEINKYMRSGTYSGRMGDLLPYIGASFLGQPLLMIALTKGGKTCTYADPTFEILGGQEEVQDPCVVVQSGSHYEDFSLSEEAKRAARQYFDKLKKGSGTALNPDSSSDDNDYMSAEEDLSQSPNPNDYATPTYESGDLTEERCDMKGPEEKGNEKGGEGAVMEYTKVVGMVDNCAKYFENEVRSRSQDVNKYSYRCLRRLDIDFFSSPRLIVRGIWRGDVLELQAKRRVEGTWVEWVMRNMTEKTTVLRVRANMMYKYGLGLPSVKERYGYKINGGWAWHGYGYGPMSLYPDSDGHYDTSIKHIDLEEAIFWEGNPTYHSPGPNCTNKKKEEGVTCKENGCGEQIWGLVLTSFSTTVHKSDSWYLPYNLRRDKQKDKTYLVLVAFHNGDSKILLHRDGPTRSFREVAWLTPANVHFDEKPDVDPVKLQKHQYIWRTSLPKNNSEDNAINKENSDQAGDDGEANLNYLIEELDDDADKNALGSQNITSDIGGRSWQYNYAGCEICQNKGFAAFHLRHSEGCLKQLRSKPPFLQIKGSDEVFIIKFALLAGECPSSKCLTGRHTVIPEECLDWWIMDNGGWVTLGWRGDREAADAHIIKEKVRRFVRYHKNERNHQQPSQPGTQVSQGQTDVEDRRKCKSCGWDGDLIQHFHEDMQCLEAYKQSYLPVADGEMDVQKTIFKVSIVLNICARVDCEQRTDFTYLGSHLSRNEDCLEFYQSEGVQLSLPKWNPEASGRIISHMIAKMRRAIKDKKRKEQSYGCVYYREELSKILSHVCSKCCAMGPVDGEHFVLRGGWQEANGDPVWRCSKCSEDSPDWEDFRRQLSNDTRRLKGPNNSQECDVRAVDSQILNRLTFAPACLTENVVHNPQLPPSLSTLVLVPNHPSAIRPILNLCDEAVTEKSELKRCSEEILRRPFVTKFEDTLSCLYRSLLAEIRSKMKDISIGLSKIARGEVLSRNPNVTSARKRPSNLDMTMECALKSLCNWSPQYEKQRSMESEARSQINGRVKIYIRGTILENLEDEELKRILLLGCKKYENVNSFEELGGDQQLEAFIIRMTPVILSYIRSKVKLFIKHIIAPNYLNHDLEIEIDDKRLSVQIHGYVYAKQFSQVNKMLAENPEIRWVPEVTDRVTAEGDLMPTTALNWQRLVEDYRIDELRAKVIAEAAHSFQIGSIASPLSLLNIWTPSGWTPSKKEMILRHRVQVLSDEKRSDENVKEAIIDITRKLQEEEGLFEELMTEEIDPEIIRSMKIKLCQDKEDGPPDAVNVLTWYHTLLIRTGGSNQWTLRRHCGEACVIPYHPLLLEALQAGVEVRIAMDPEHIETKGVCYGASAHEGIMAGYAWKEISILKFLGGISGVKLEELASQAIVTVITSQEDELNFMDANEKDEECDEIFINSKEENYIITNNDFRKLYMKRPFAVEVMTFAEFVISYYRKTARQQTVIDRQSGIGESSGELVQVVGGGNLCAPISMKLRNNIILKRRSDKSKVVPLLLHCNTLDNYGERMLFQPWRNFEELLERQEEEDKEQQKQNRLKIFPMCFFPRKGPE